MLNKISSVLDVIADRLEAKGLIKEAYEVDKIADAIGLTANDYETALKVWNEYSSIHTSFKPQFSVWCQERIKGV
jgi:hypothetical protein